MHGMGWRRWGRRGLGPLCRRLLGEALSRLDERRLEGLERLWLPLPPGGGAEPVVLYTDELEVFTLVYLEGLSQEEAAERLGVSRARVWRLLDSARRKLAEALGAGKPIALARPG